MAFIVGLPLELMGIVPLFRRTPSAVALPPTFPGVLFLGRFGRLGQPSGVGAFWCRTFADPASLPDVDARLCLATLLDRGALRFRRNCSGGAVLAAGEGELQWS